jgi:hypothetical protein
MQAQHHSFPYNRSLVIYVFLAFRTVGEFYKFQTPIPTNSQATQCMHLFLSRTYNQR